MAASCAASAFYVAVGERYEVYTLMRVGQGIKDKNSAASGPFGEVVDLASRLDSLARIGTTDQVIADAMDRVGRDRLFNEKDLTLLARLNAAASQKIVEATGRPPAEPDPTLARAEAVATLRDLISARQEGRSDLLRIAFRFPDPVVAAEFLNELANSLVGAQAGLVQLPGADIFFQDQAKRLEQEAEKAATELKNFSIAASIYSTAEQRNLLLKRASDLGSLVATTRGSIVDGKGQRQAIIDQLLVMRPVTQSKTVTGIVQRLGGRDFKPSTASEAPPAFEEAPPLLLVKVYQDGMANLLKINSDLSGAVGLEALLQKELATVNAQLADLTTKEAEYERLRRLVTRASSAADYYGTRLMEEQINLDSAKKTQLSSVRVVQLADRPIVPMFPRVHHLAVLALAGGFALGAAIALLLEVERIRRLKEEEEERLLADKLARFPTRIAAAE
ncbi:hypothetical protein [uncultured Methylobacterium sp.]|uniref:hypothetical protein n=1 Tax=uncultured Methylobacterium sp. TaxID=157278 RepID=UPI00260295A6|nr:hypothetical protein [uncultured Methylobacterium sp.]